MKRLFPLTLVASAVLATACQQPAETATADVDADGSGLRGARIAYVNTDSILGGYAYLEQQGVILSQREQDATAELERKLRKFQGQVESLQRRAGAGNLTPKQIESEQRVLAQREQELAAEQQRLAAEFQGEGLRLQNELATVLKRETAAIQAAEGYDYVLTYGGTSPVIVVNPEFDITSAVLARMNAAGAPAVDTAGGQ